jgi:hypothetical protein
MREEELGGTAGERLGRRGRSSFRCGIAQPKHGDVRWSRRSGELQH